MSISLIFSKKNKLILSSVFIVLFLLFNSFLSDKYFISASYFDFIFFEFIFGMAAFVIWKKFKDKIPLNLFNHLIFLLFLFLTTFILNYFYTIRSISYGVPAFILLIYFLFFLNDKRFPKIFVTLGDASYCIYLLHPYIVQTFYKIFEIGKYGFIIQSFFTVIIVILVCLISILIYKLIELPINVSLRKKFVKQ